MTRRFRLRTRHAPVARQTPEITSASGPSATTAASKIPVRPTVMNAIASGTASIIATKPQNSRWRARESWVAMIRELVSTIDAASFGSSARKPAADNDPHRSQMTPDDAT